METAASLSLSLARWFEAPLCDSFVPHSALAKLHVLDVIDRRGVEQLDPAAVRVGYVGEATEMMALAHVPAAAYIADHDAFAVVTTRWLPPPLQRTSRPGDFPPRRRARVVHVVTDEGTASVARFDDDPELVVLESAA
jgi:hypothetical protein